MEFRRVNINDLKSAWGPLSSNRYVIAALISLMIIGVFDSENLIKSYNLSRDIDALKEEKAELELQIEVNKQKIRDLQNDKASLEKFAREEYFMKKKDEVIFIVK